MNTIKYGLGALICLLGLSACYHPYTPPKPDFSQRSVVVSHLTKQTEASLHFGQVYQVGQTIHIVLQSDQVFNRHSANLTEQIKPALKLVAHLLRTYFVAEVQITAHTDSAGSAQFRRSLTQRQAEVLMDYFKQAGVQVGLWVTHGVGASDPVASNATTWGRGQNRRVTLVFRFEK